MLLIELDKGTSKNFSLFLETSGRPNENSVLNKGSRHKNRSESSPNIFRCYRNLVVFAKPFPSRPRLRVAPSVEDRMLSVDKRPMVLERSWDGYELTPEERCASTSNRNFEGRQGFKGRTHLVSPAMAAAAAIAGHFVDIREWR